MILVDKSTVGRGRLKVLVELKLLLELNLIAAENLKWQHLNRCRIFDLQTIICNEKKFPIWQLRGNKKDLIAVDTEESDQ